MFLMHINILMMYTRIAAFTAPSGELPSFDSPKSVSFALAFERWPSLPRKLNDDEISAGLFWDVWYTQIAMHLEQNNRTRKTSYGRSSTRLKAQKLLLDLGWVWCHYTGHGQHQFHGKIHGHVRPAKHSQASSPCQSTTRTKGTPRDTRIFPQSKSCSSLSLSPATLPKKTNWTWNSFFGSFWTIFVDISHLGAPVIENHMHG